MVAGRDLTVCRPLGEALAAAGLVVQRLVTRAEDPDALLARADAEGNVPVAVTWDAGGDGIHLVLEMLARDMHPMRPFVLVVPTDVVAGIAHEELERAHADVADRVLVIPVAELASASTRELLRMHLSRGVLGLTFNPRRLRAVPAPVTDFPGAERTINNIERRAMQRGAFRLAALRTPRF